MSTCERCEHGNDHLVVYRPWLARLRGRPAVVVCSDFDPVAGGPCLCGAPFHAAVTPSGTSPASSTR